MDFNQKPSKKHFHMGLTLSNTRDEEEIFAYQRKLSPVKQMGRETLAESSKVVRKMLLNGPRAIATSNNTNSSRVVASDADALSLALQEGLKPLNVADLASNLNNINACNRYLVLLSPPSLGLFSSTTKLLLCCNKLKEIPREIGFMRSLTHLSLNKNRLTELPVEIGFLIKLEELLVADNQLQYLPPSIGALTKLQTLSFANNDLMEIPAQLGRLKNLESLDLSSNSHLQTIPAEIARLSLRSCNLTKCESLLQHVPPIKGMGVSSLMEISARVIVRKIMFTSPNFSTSEEFNSIPLALKNYLASYNECTCCGGPYFQNYASRVRLIMRGEDSLIPFEHRLCVNHWKTEEERLISLFAPLPADTTIDRASTGLGKNVLIRTSSNADITNTNNLNGGVRPNPEKTLRSRSSSLSLLATKAKLRKETSMESIQIAMNTQQLQLPKRDSLIKRLSSVRLRSSKSLIFDDSSLHRI